MFTPDLWPLYSIAAGCTLLGLVLLCLPVRGLSRWRRGRAQPGGPGRPGLTACAIEALAGVTLLSLAVAALSLVMALTGYRAMSEKTLCAVVRADPVPQNRGRMLVIFTPVEDGVERRDRQRAFGLDGDQWRIEGHFLRWSNWARYLGLKTCFRLTRIDGRFSAVREALSRQPTVVDLGGEDSWLWRQLRARGGRLPGVESVQGGGGFTEPAAGAVFEVYATPGGFVIHKR